MKKSVLKFPLSVNADVFIQHYWQQQPLLFKAGLNQAIDIISKNEIIELSLSDRVESRLIIQSDETFHGPQDEDQLKSLLNQTHWTLLVQSTNLWHQGCRSLLQYFDFIPEWRLDDIMVSYSTVDGSVGAHLDQYDVFLIQISGSRRWKVGTPNTEVKTVESQSGVTLVDEFDPILDVPNIDILVQPGDILYIPPNTVHHGITVTGGITLSVGFRSPALSEMMMLIAEQQMQSKYELYYKDPIATKTKTSRCGIDELSMQQAETWYLNSTPTSEMMRKAFGLLQTQPKQELIYEQPQNILDATLILKRDPASRLAWYEHGDDNIWLFINGELTQHTAADKDIIIHLCQQQTIPIADYGEQLEQSKFIILLQLFVDLGAFGIE